MASFIQSYLDYTEESEPPKVYHRWCAITTIGALLGRNFYIQHGHSRIFPNLYVMLIGEPAARKSTAIKLIKRLVRNSGYNHFAANKTTKEKFLLDLEGVTPEFGEDGKKSNQAVFDAVTAENLWGSDNAFREPKECFIAADEWNEFCGSGNIDFYSTLGDLWDWDDETSPYTSRVKNSKSVSIWQPTISILGGNTPENYARAFPPEIIGQGFLSRMLHIYGQRSGKLYTFPPTPSKEATDAIVAQLAHIRTNVHGVATLSEAALQILDTIYKGGWTEINDVRFKSYNNRRFTQLLKLCLILTAESSGTVITDEVVIRANTVLSAAEHLMPKALGEFGKSKNSDVANKVMEALLAASKPLSVRDIWKHVHQDLEKIVLLQDILQGLIHAEKIQYVRDPGGYLPRQTAIRRRDFVDFSLLTSEERDGINDYQ